MSNQPCNCRACRWRRRHSPKKGQRVTLEGHGNFRIVDRTGQGKEPYMPWWAVVLAALLAAGIVVEAIVTLQAIEWAGP